MFLLPADIARECAKSGGYVFGAGGIDKKRLGTVGRALVAADIAEERFIADSRCFGRQWVSLKSALKPTATFQTPLVRLKRASVALCRVLVSYSLRPVAGSTPAWSGGESAKQQSAIDRIKKPQRRRRAADVRLLRIEFSFGFISFGWTLTR